MSTGRSNGRVPGVLFVFGTVAGYGLPEAMGV